MPERSGLLRQPTVLSVRPRVYRGEWLQSAITRWAWSIFGVSRGTLLDAFGLAELSEHEIRHLGHRASEDVLENIEESIGLPVDVLHRMTMEGATRGPEISRTSAPSIASRYLWARRTGTRYCPDCLLEHPGVFYAAWRLNWTFACVRHERILLDSCPECLLPLSEPTGRSRYLWDPNRCRANISGGLPVSRCGADLTVAWDESRLPDRSFVLLAQAQISRAIDRVHSAGGLFHTLRGNASALRAAGEVDLIATLSGLPLQDLAGLIETEKRVGATAPSNALATAALVTAAFMLTKANDASIGPWIRRVTFSRPPAPVPRGAGYGPGSPRELLAKWGQPDGAMREKILAAHDQDFTISQRLVYGSALSSVRRYAAPTAAEDGRPFVQSQQVPELLWTEWATPLDGGGAATEWALRSALSAALQTVDKGEQLPEYIDRTRTSDARSEDRVRRLTRLLRPKMVGSPEDADRARARYHRTRDAP
ncbi:TniQ family protein [Curtobacterium sp. VKM Ac-2887]|uniref:TniQ family protein n=1 Tax=Curtobacterium sp. VKM Ac-2887 TaxID=2783819 RepID=UPI00188B631C|nr:TniQ family protein [Curtobacterium sp. VKM Ac-2887]MBF4586434.1 TniQ family protein [Curtobacterium sp. VKM Ac-2887]